MRALLVVALLGCTHPSSVPITLGPNHELLVPAEINGEAVVLQLDTGASMTALTPAARDRLGLLLNGTVGFGTGAGGTIDSIACTRVEHTTVAQFGAKNLPIAIIDVGGASDGLLGMDILQYFLLEVDLSANQLTLHSRGGDAGELTRGLVAVPYRSLSGGQIAIEIAMAGREMTAIVDLGANRSFANHLANGRREETARVLTATVGADGHPWTFLAFDRTGLAIGDVPLVAPSLLVADLPIFERLGLADQPAVILGTDLLGARRIVLDPTSHTLFFSRDAKPGAPPARGPIRLRLV